MENNTLALASLAMDLKRVALGLHSGSTTTAKRFAVEARKRTQEINREALVPYMQTIISQLDNVLVDSPAGRTAEDALMYSQIIQNYVVKEQVQR